MSYGRRDHDDEPETKTSYHTAYRIARKARAKIRPGDLVVRITRRKYEVGGPTLEYDTYESSVLSADGSYTNGTLDPAALRARFGRRLNAVQHAGLDAIEARIRAEQERRRLELRAWVEERRLRDEAIHRATHTRYGERFRIEDREYEVVGYGQRLQPIIDLDVIGNETVQTIRFRNTATGEERTLDRTPATYPNF